MKQAPPGADTQQQARVVKGWAPADDGDAGCTGQTGRDDTRHPRDQQHTHTAPDAGCTPPHHHHHSSGGASSSSGVSSMCMASPLGSTSNAGAHSTGGGRPPARISDSSSRQTQPGVPAAPGSQAMKPAGSVLNSEASSACCDSHVGALLTGLQPAAADAAQQPCGDWQQQAPAQGRAGPSGQGAAASGMLPTRGYLQEAAAAALREQQQQQQQQQPGLLPPLPEVATSCQQAACSPRAFVGSSGTLAAATAAAVAATPPAAASLHPAALSAVRRSISLPVGFSMQPPPPGFFECEPLLPPAAAGYQQSAATGQLQRTVSGGAAAHAPWQPACDGGAAGGGAYPVHRHSGSAGLGPPGPLPPHFFTHEGAPPRMAGYAAAAAGYHHPADIMMPGSRLGHVHPAFMPGAGGPGSAGLSGGDVPTAPPGWGFPGPYGGFPPPRPCDCWECRLAVMHSQVPPSMLPPPPARGYGGAGPLWPYGSGSGGSYPGAPPPVLHAAEPLLGDLRPPAFGPGGSSAGTGPGPLRTRSLPHGTNIAAAAGHGGGGGNGSGRPHPYELARQPVSARRHDSGSALPMDGPATYSRPAGSSRMQPPQPGRAVATAAGTGGYARDDGSVGAAAWQPLNPLGRTVSAPGGALRNAAGDAAAAADSASPSVSGSFQQQWQHIQLRAMQQGSTPRARAQPACDRLDPAEAAAAPVAWLPPASPAASRRPPGGGSLFRSTSDAGLLSRHVQGAGQLGWPEPAFAAAAAAVPPGGGGLQRSASLGARGAAAAPPLPAGVPPDFAAASSVSSWHQQQLPVQLQGTGLAGGHHATTPLPAAAAAGVAQEGGGSMSGAPPSDDLLPLLPGSSDDLDALQRVLDEHGDEGDDLLLLSSELDGLLQPMDVEADMQGML